MFVTEYEGREITCPILRVIDLRDGTIELLVYNPVTKVCQYFYERVR